jgi:hypothetical protein
MQNILTAFAKAGGVTPPDRVCPPSEDHIFLFLTKYMFIAKKANAETCRSSSESRGDVIFARRSLL